MKAAEIRRITNHQLGPFEKVPMGVGPVARCARCGLGVTQPMKKAFRGQTWVWQLGKTGSTLSDSENPLTVRAILMGCPE